jgi:death-on-curing protein
LPSEVVKFLSLDEVIAIQERLIERFGGATGLRDKGLLESAVYRPQTGYYEDLPQMAAALFESLINNHAFVDGNKRVAFFACDVFLRLNGWKLAVDSTAAYEFIVGKLGANDCSFENLAPWMSKHLVKLE